MQELSGSLSFMADLLVAKVEVFLLTRNLEKGREQEKEREKERKKKQKWLELKESILPVGGYFAFFGFCGMVGGMVGEFNPLFGAIAGIILGVIIII